MATQARQPASGSDEPSTLSEQLRHEIVGLDAELTEIDMLIQQARTEAERHQAKRSAVDERLAASKRAGAGDPAELIELYVQLVNLTKRAIVMESQVDVLGGKHKALRRHRDRLARLADELVGVVAPTGTASSGGSTAGAHGRTGTTGSEADGDGSEPAPALDEPLPPGISRMLLAAQEDLRRDIARAMHDGPAQSLTNIVLQAQIVERLTARDPAAAMPEVRQLIAMVQSTLDATKSFIFDVRPMVLDDLGLLPTLRRAARDRGRRAQIPVDFDSLGPDRRLPMELESALFRMLEEALVAYLSVRPERVTIRLDWSDQLVAIVRSSRERPGGQTEAASAGDVPGQAAAVGAARVQGTGRGSGRGRGRGKGPTQDAELPAALAAMIEDRRGERAAVDAQAIAPLAMPAKPWRDIQSRAATLGARAELSADGTEVRLTVDLPGPA